MTVKPEKRQQDFQSIIVLQTDTTTQLSVKPPQITNIKMVPVNSYLTAHVLHMIIFLVSINVLVSPNETPKSNF